MFWDDLKVSSGSTDGIWYYANSTYAIFEWRLHRSYDQVGTDPYQFSLAYSTTSPGVYVFRYYQVGSITSDGYQGLSASIGIQGDQTGELSSPTHFSKGSVR